MADFISQFMALTEGIPSPPMFRLWSGICAIASALERRVWVETSRSLMYPNLFVLLVGPPGSGKTQAIDPARDLLISTRKFKLSPDNMTKAALVDSLVDADRKIIVPTGLIEYHSLGIHISELGVFLPAHDVEFLSVLNYIFDNPRSYRERRRHGNSGLPKEITHPQINILAGSQPGFLATLLPEEAWSMGFTSRLIMVYQTVAPRVPYFGVEDKREGLRKQLIDDLINMAGMRGKFWWEKDAAREIEDWAEKRCPPEPQHNKLLHYNARRAIHVLKLSMISAISRGQELRITLGDVKRARAWLLEAEALMPDVFRDMITKSDGQIIQELHFFLWRLWIKEHRPIHEARLVNFLANRVPSEKVLRLIEVAERSNIITREAGNSRLFTPRAQELHGEDDGERQ